MANTQRNTSIATRLRDLMPKDYGKIIAQRLGYADSCRTLVYTVVNKEDKQHPIYKEALLLAAETQAEKLKEQAEQEELEQRLLCAS